MSVTTKSGEQHELPETQELLPPEPAPGRKRRRWWLCGAAVMLVAFLWLLPAIVAHTPLLRWVVAQAAAELRGTVTVRSCSLGWFSPIRAKGIEIRDAEGKPVLQAAKLEGDRSLAAILWNLSELGQFRLEGPKLTVELRGDGSNLEDLLADYLTSTEESKPVSTAIEVVDGSVSITDQTSRQSWQIEKLQLSLSLSADAGRPLKLKTSGTISDPQHPGRFAVDLNMQRHDPKDQPPAKDSPKNGPPTKDPSATAGELTIEARAVPLTMFQSLVGRFAPQTRLAGRVSSKGINVQWGDKTVVRAEVTTDGFTLDGPALGTDRVQLERLHAACQITQRDGRVEIKQSTLDCDLGNATFTSTIDLGRKGARPLLSPVLYQTHEIQGRVDLARLARMLPNTLRIRKETQITSGQVELALRSRPNPQSPGPQGMVWQGRIEADDLKAVYRGRELTWERPILLTLAAHDSQLGPVVESLKCESEFLKLHAAGTFDDLAASASFNLKQLADQLGQFVDLGGIGLSGDGWAQLNWKRSAEQQFEADAQLQVRDLQLAMREGQPWVEENLLVSLSANGRTDFGADTQLQAASLQLKAGSDRIDARLTRPVLDFHGGGTWPLDVQMQGQLENWPARLRTRFALNDCSMAGAYTLDTRATGSTGGVTVHRARLTVDGLQLAAPWLNVDEPNAELVLSGGWHRQQRRLQMEAATLTSSAVSIQANQVVLAMPEDGPIETTGLLKYQGDLQRLLRWFADPKATPTWRVAGELAGTAQLSQSAGLTHAQLDADVGNLTVTNSSGEQFREPRVRLVARGDYEHRAKLVRLEQLELSSGTLGANATGRITQTDEQTAVELSGQLDYDLAKLSELLRPYIGPQIRIAGSGSGPASYRGPLSPAGALANAEVSWEWADVYGFQIGPGEFKAALADGVLQAEPLDLAASQGRLLLAPRVRLAPGPAELTLPPGPLARQMQITPKMAASMLKFIAPVLAGASEAEGSFSIELEGCRIPLDDPATGELAGQFIIHSIQVGPGPLVREMAVLLGKAAPAKLRRESVVNFRMVKGRVYHQGLELIFPDLTIRTYGSVGLDQSLAIIAEMPVPPKWLGNNVVGSALKDKTIRLPIGGTLDKPQIDQRRLEQLTRQFLENAARDAVGHEIGKQLERLLRPQR